MIVEVTKEKLVSVLVSLPAYFSKQELADSLGIGWSQIDALIKKYQLPTVKIGRTHAIEKKSFEEAVQHMQTDSKLIVSGVCAQCGKSFERNTISGKFCSVICSIRDKIVIKKEGDHWVTLSGAVNFQGATYRINRYLFEQEHGTLLKEKFVIRTCEQDGCVNPLHNTTSHSPLPMPMTQQMTQRDATADSIQHAFMELVKGYDAQLVTSTIIPFYMQKVEEEWLPQAVVSGKSHRVILLLSFLDYLQKQRDVRV